jgi:hypothetical protein
MKSDGGTIENGESLLRRICGARLTSVQFVLDYLILGFDEKGALTTLVWPEILDGDNSTKFGTEHYRDRLCALITKIVLDVTVSADETILISFQYGVSLHIPLAAYKLPGERAIFTAPPHHLFAWYRASGSEVKI